MVMDKSILVMKSMVTIMKSLSNTVIKMVMVALMLVKFTLVLSNAKTHGEMNTVQDTDTSTVIVHSVTSFVMELGAVKTFLPSPWNS